MIVFDFDGVLSDSRLWYEDVCRLVSEVHGANYDKLLSWMIEHGNRSWISGTWNDEHFVSSLNRTFGTAATIDEIETACEDSMRLSSDVLQLIVPFRSITIFTDNPLVRVRVIERSLPIPSTIICSQQVGVRKHHGFEKFVEASGITSALFIDDYVPNVNAARAAGFEGLVWQLGKNDIEELREAIARNA